MQKDYIVRPTVAADLEAIGNIAEATDLFPSSMLPDMIAGYLDGSKPDIWLTANSDYRAVAFAFCEPERLTNGTWNLLAIAVEPSRQGHGIGADLVSALEDRLRLSHHRVLLVETLGTEEFARTRAFYLANGFAEEARIRDFYDEGGDKVIFWKHL